MDWTHDNNEDSPTPETPAVPESTEQPQFTPVAINWDEDDPTSDAGASTTTSPGDTPPKGEWAAPTAPVTKTRSGARQTALLVTGGLVLVAAIGGTGFIVGHYVGRGSTNSASGSFPRIQFPSGNFPNFGNFGNSGSFGGLNNGFGGTTVTPTTLPANSPSSAAAARIAAKVDVGVVDITTTSSYNSSSAAGTGMILSSNGLVLTNNHVINGATSINVRVVATNRTYTAKVLGYSVSKDVALLQMSGASGLTAVTTASSSNVTKNEAVVGIGNAGGVGGTPSYAPGAVVATNQSVTASDPSNLTGAEKLSGMIEVDAAIEAGDSGGPLVNAKGEVIGMDTAGSSNGSSTEINGEYVSNTQGFAIPISTALSIVRTIQAGTSTSVVHVGSTPIIGIEINPTLSGYQNSNVSGVQIAGLAAGTPAASSGLVAGDIITAINGQSVANASQLSTIVQKFSPGDSVKVSYTTASGTSTSVNVTLVAGPAL